MHQCLFLCGGKDQRFFLAGVYRTTGLFFPIALYTLPLFFELNGVWLALSGSTQLALAALCIALYIRVEHRANRSESAAVGSFEINLRNDAVKE